MDSDVEVGELAVEGIEAVVIQHITLQPPHSYPFAMSA